MPTRLSQALAGLLASALLVPPAAARPFTVEDLLRTESFGQVSLDPAGRRLVIERRGPYVSSPEFDYDIRTDWALARLFVADLAKPGPARPLLPAAAGMGYLAGPWSPDGRRLAVYRLSGHRWRLGVITLVTRSLTWLAAAPEDAQQGRTVQWRSNTELLALSRADGRAPRSLRGFFDYADRQPGRWAATARGHGQPSVIGSGADRTARDRAAPHELLAFDLARHTRRVLARGDLTDLEIAPDGHAVALLEAGEDLQPKAGEPLQGDYGLATQIQRLSRLDLATGRRTPLCAGCDVLNALLSWSPDSRDLLVFARGPDAPWTAGAFHRLGPDGRDTVLDLGAHVPALSLRPEGVRTGWLDGAPVVLAHPTEAPDRDVWLRLTPDGPIALTAALKDPHPVLAALGDGAALAVADGVAWRLDATGHAQQLGGAPATGAAWPRRLLEPRLGLTPPRRDWMLLQDPDGALRQVSAAIGPSVGSTDVAPGASGAGAVPRPADSELLAWSPAYRTAVLRAADDRGRQAIVLARAGAAPRTVATINARLAAIDPPRVIAIHHPGPDGAPLTSWLLLPPRAAGSPPPPLLVRPYLGDNYRAVRISAPFVGDLVANAPAFVGHGYALLLPSLPIRRGDPAPWTGVADRILAIVRAAADQPDSTGTFDAGRLGLWGQSYGGYTVVTALTQSEAFRAAVVSGAPTDLLAMWGTFQPNWRYSPEDGIDIAWHAGWTETAQGAMGAPPWAAPQRYVAGSPIFAADRITTPLLILHGDQDVVGLAQAETLFTSLYRQDKDALLVTYWGEGHMLNSPATLRDRYARGFAWLDRGFAINPPPAAAVPRPARAAARPAPRTR